MWYASCSSGAQWIPSTVVPGDVLEAGASCGPCSSGIPSGPIDGRVLVVSVDADRVAVVCASLDEFDELEPHPATASAITATRSAEIRLVAARTAAEYLQEEQEDVEDVEEDAGRDRNRARLVRAPQAV